MARAIWKGNLVLGKHEVPVKFYSGLEDRKIHFHLLHAKDQAPVEQHIIRKDTGAEVEKDDRRKALALTRDSAVVLQPEDLARLEPPESRDIQLSRFIAPRLLSDQWYERPYYLGPDGEPAAYFALVEAIERREVVGIARWVMRKKRYVGALGVSNGYLVMTTLRRADQVLSFSGAQPAKSNAPTDREVKLAEQLVASIAGDFEPEQWPNEYRQRLCELIAAKARGDKLKPHKAKRVARAGSLADSLKASIAAAREKKVA